MLLAFIPNSYKLESYELYSDTDKNLAQSCVINVAFP